MKKVFFISMALFAYAIAYSQGWQIIDPSPTGKNLYSVFMVSQGIAYASGDSGLILKTTDGGSHWSKLVSGTSKTLFSLCFTSQNTGYAAGDSGIIIKTTDGGANWSMQTPISSISLRSVNFPDANNGYAVGESYGAIASVILRTTDAGLSWNWFGTGSPSDLFSVHFPDANTGYAVGGFPVPGLKSSLIMKTTDRGSTWKTQSISSPECLFSVYFADAKTGFAVGTNGAILKTTTGGVDPAGIDDHADAMNILKIFPIPSSSKIYINSSCPIIGAEMSVCNTRGQQVQKNIISGIQPVIDISRLQEGVYIIRIITPGRVLTGKFIRN